MKRVIVSKIGRLAASLLTTAVCITSAVYPQAYEDYALFLTLCILAGTGYVLYHIFFDREKGVYAFYLSCLLLMMVFVNRMFSSSYILQRMPWVGKINKGLAVFVSLGVMTAVFGGIKIFRKMGSTFSAYETEPKESHTDRSSATGRQDSGSVIDTGAARTAGGMQNQSQSQKKAGSTRDRFAERVFIALFVTTVFLVLVSVLVAAVITPMLAGDTSAESLFEYTMNKILALLPYGALALVILGTVGSILVALLGLSRYILAKCLSFISELRSGGMDGKGGIPLYLLSVFVVLVLFALSFELGEFTLDDFMDLAVDGKYLALPLLLILMFAVFTLLLWLVHGLLLLIRSLNAREVYEKFKSFGSEIRLVENCKDILKLLFDFLFSTILSVLEFLKIIPDYVKSMKSLLDVCPQDKEEHNEEE